MPRRRALRLLGGVLATATIPGLGASGALAGGRRSTECPGKTKRCFVKIPFGTHEGGCYYPNVEKCCIGPNIDPVHPNQMSWICGKNDGCGKAGACERACPQDTFKCGKACCQKVRPTLPAEVCYQNRCRPACPSNTTKCGTTCCTKKQTCKNGKCCEKCGGNGACCDPATTYCCREPGDPKSPGRCCKKDKESCCGVGPPDKQVRMCCAKPNKCTRQLPEGIGGLTAASPWVCCPPDRQVPIDETRPKEIKACCAPGQVTLGGKLVVGNGIQGMCCNKAQVCGSGAAITCCQTGQSCIGGTTCA